MQPVLETQGEIIMNDCEDDLRSENIELRDALQGLMWTEDMLADFDDPDSENPFDVARKLLGD